MPKKLQTTALLTTEQEHIHQQLVDMGMEASLAKEAASMGLDMDLALSFCLEEDVRAQERANHQAALFASRAREGTRSGGAGSAAASLARKSAVPRPRCWFWSISLSLSS